MNKCCLSTKAPDFQKKLRKEEVEEDQENTYINAFDIFVSDRDALMWEKVFAM